MELAKDGEPLEDFQDADPEGVACMPKGRDPVLEAQSKGWLTAWACTKAPGRFMSCGTPNSAALQVMPAGHSGWWS